MDVPLPRRVVIVSAGMGEGHNAAASALSDTIQDCWPGCVVERLDTMELRGARFRTRHPLGLRVPALRGPLELRRVLRPPLAFRRLRQRNEEDPRPFLWAPTVQCPGSQEARPRHLYLPIRKCCPGLASVQEGNGHAYGHLYTRVPCSPALGLPRHRYALRHVRLRAGRRTHA